MGTVSAVGVTTVSLWLGYRAAWRGLIYVVSMTLVAFIIFYATSALVIVGVGYFLFGGWTALRPVATSLLSDTVRSDQHGNAFASLELLEGVGGIAAPVLAGVLYARQGDLPVIGAIILTGITLAVTLWLAKDRNKTRPLTYSDIANQ